MIAQVPTEVIPVWYIEKWAKENAEPGSPLDHFIKTMVNDWRVEERVEEIISARNPLSAERNGRILG